MSEEERVRLQIELVEVASDMRTLLAARDLARDRVVRISRALAADATLTDAEALAKAFPEALEATLQVRKGA